MKVNLNCSREEIHEMETAGEEIEILLLVEIFFERLSLCFHLLHLDVISTFHRFALLLTFFCLYVDWMFFMSQFAQFSSYSHFIWWHQREEKALWKWTTGWLQPPWTWLYIFQQSDNSLYQMYWHHNKNSRWMFCLQRSNKAKKFSFHPSSSSFMQNRK